MKVVVSDPELGVKSNRIVTARFPMAQSFPQHAFFRSLSVSDQICEHIRSAIARGVLKPNQRLTELSIANELQVSRTPIRESFHRLEAEGLIEYVPKKGVVVCAFSLEEIAQIYELRALLEGYAGKLAATKITANDLQSLEDLLQSFEQALNGGGDPTEQIYRFVDLNKRFHSSIIRISGSKKLVRILRIATELPLVYRAYNWYSEEETRIAHGYHKRILVALKEKDSNEAERLIQEHLTHGKIAVLRELKKSTGQPVLSRESDNPASKQTEFIAPLDLESLNLKSIPHLESFPDSAR
jgi:DNA-binding GntR family transcriptional regulator